MKAYFTFGQCHTHSYNGMTLDKDCVVEITADDPREVMHELFGVKWSMQYDDPPNRKTFPGRWVSIER